MKKETWQLVPTIGTSGRSWCLRCVSHSESGKSHRDIGYYKTIKAAKAAAAHIRRKPIELP